MSKLEPNAKRGTAPTRQAREISERCTRGSIATGRLLAVTVLALTVLARPVAAQTGNDYYRTRSEKALNDLLRQVEKYHLDPGVSNLRAGRYQYAYNEVNFILNYFPNHPRALVLMSEICTKWKQPARCNSDAYLQRAIQVNAQAADTYTIRGMYLQNTGRIDEAIEDYGRAVELKPTSVSAHYNLGLAYVSKKDFVRANEHAQQAYALGVTLPGLRDMLTKAGAWKPLPSEPAKPSAAATPPAQDTSPAAAAAPPANPASESGPPTK